MFYCTRNTCYTIVAAATIWGPYWQGKAILCFCDNMAVVAAINAGRAKFPSINRLLCCCFSSEHFFTVQFQLHIFKALAIHWQMLFHATYHLLTPPQESPTQNSIPLQLHQLLLDKTLDCAASNSRAYSQLINAYLQFCSSFNISPTFSLLEATLCYYMAHLQCKGLKHSTMKSYLSGIRHAQIALNNA